MGVIRTAHINQMADFTEARDRLGELIRRLIWNYLPNRVVGMHFLSGETNNYPGWDGWLRLNLANGISHNSLWELSARKDAVEKIRSDFAAAAERALPPGWAKSTTTYVAVTARSLGNKDSLEEELRSSPNNDWADVQIVDAKSLEQWVEVCPAVEQWLAEVFAVSGMPSATSLSQYWSRWSGVTQPNITPELMVAGRDIEALKSSLDFEASRLLSLQTDSPDEAIGVVYAAIQQLPELQRDKLLYNATVLTSEETALRMSEQPYRDEGEPLTVLVPPATSQAHALAKRGHKVVLALGRSSPGVSQISLRRALRSDFTKALVDTMGISDADAVADARACGASISIWRVWRLLRSGVADNVPGWAKLPANRQVIPAVLARAWDEAVGSDTEILSLLAGSAYTDYRDCIHEYLACNDPLHERAGSVHSVIAPSVAYALVRDSITPTHIDKLSNALNRVFSTIDSSVADVWDTLEINQPLSDQPTYSSWLKDGLAETLLAIAFLPQPQTGVLDTYGGGQAFADVLVRQLPGLSSDPRLIASLSGQLPILAEAAPVPFVEALEQLLQGQHDLEPLFRDRSFFGRPFHVGLLRSLEVLAWSTTYLSRVSRILLSLTDYDTGRWGNNPAGSLREIYIAWSRGTSVPGDRRAELLDQLSVEFPDAVWRLVTELLPKDHDTCNGTHEPVWHDFGRSDLGPLTRREVSRCYRAYIELALRLARGSTERQIDLIEFFVRLPDEHREALLQMLEADDRTEPIHRDQWQRLREFISRNRAFASAGWAVDAANLQRIERIAETLEPMQPSDRLRWLFDDAWPEIGTLAEDFEQKEETLDALRRDAAATVINEEGVGSLDALIGSVNCPHILAAAVAKLPLTREWLLDRIEAWIARGGRNELQAISAASGVREGLEGEEWTSALRERAGRSHWSPVAIGQALLNFPFAMRTFNLVEACGPAVSQIYWRECWLRPQALNYEAKAYVANKLLEHGRAADLLVAVDYHFEDFGTEIVLAAVDAAAQGLVRSQQRVLGNGAYHFTNAFRWLRRQPDTDRARLARLEYSLIPLLTGNRSDDEDTLVLHEILASDPSFFSMIICDAYRGKADAEANPDAPLDDATRTRARAAWRLLRSWEVVPGEEASGRIDEAALKSWLSEVLRLATESDRLEVALLKIGEVLYHAKPDPDTQTWPQEPVLRLIEESASEYLERGFSLECVNSRGATVRAPLGGGSLERELQQQWELRAANLAPRWVRSRAMFLRIAEDWARQGKWHDEQAAQTRMRW